MVSDVTIKRFWANVEQHDGCWAWHGGKTNGGYGYVYDRRRIVLAHRLSYWLHHGDIQGIVRHTCDNPECTNPAHLLTGTQKDNAQDCIKRGRRAKTHRPHTRHRKLTEAQVYEIRGDLRPLKELAAQYGVSITTVHYIRKGKRKQLV